MLWTTNALLLPHRIRSKSIIHSSTVIAQGMITTLCHINVLPFPAQDSKFTVSPAINSTIRAHHTTVPRLSLIHLIAWQLTTHIQATIMFVQQATTQSRLAKLLHTITTIWTISAPLSTKMRNTATCMELITISQQHNVHCFMINPRHVKPQARVTICQC
jgi:hypothetical protein